MDEGFVKERSQPSPAPEYVGVKMVVHSEVDLTLFVEGQEVGRVDRRSPCQDCSEALIRVAPGSDLLKIQASSFERSLNLLDFFSPQDDVWRVRVGTCPSDMVRISEEEKLEALGSAQEALQDLKTAKSDAARAWALERLGYLGAPNDRTREALLGALADEQVGIRIKAAEAFGRIGRQWPPDVRDTIVERVREGLKRIPSDHPLFPMAEWTFLEAIQRMKRAAEKTTGETPDPSQTESS